MKRQQMTRSWKRRRGERYAEFELGYKKGREEGMKAGAIAGEQAAEDRLTRVLFFPPQTPDPCVSPNEMDIWLSEKPEQPYVRVRLGMAFNSWRDPCFPVHREVVFEPRIMSQMFEFDDRSCPGGRARLIVRWPEWRRVA